jgi:hypothetical protein
MSRTSVANSEAIARECHVDLLSPEVVPPQARVPAGCFPTTVTCKRFAMRAFAVAFPLATRRRCEYSNMNFR